MSSTFNYLRFPKSGYKDVRIITKFKYCFNEFVVLEE